MRFVTYGAAGMISAQGFSEAEAQVRKFKVAYVGFSGSSGSKPFWVFRERMRELGYVEGQNVAIEWRPIEGGFDHLIATLEDLVRIGCDVIVAPCGEPSTASKADG